METDFNTRFNQHLQRYPEGTEEALRGLSVRSDLLSIEGITKVLDVLHAQLDQAEQPELKVVA